MYKIISGTIVETERELNKLAKKKEIKVIQMCANHNITVILVKLSDRTWNVRPRPHSQCT